METTPYIVEQGDYLLKIATRHGFDAHVVWNLPENAALKKQRRNPNVLCPGDVLYVPQSKRTFFPIKVGETNTFSATVPMIAVNVNLVLNGKACGGLNYTVEYAGGSVKGTTTGSGSVSFKVPVTVSSAVLEIPGYPLIPLHVGHADPIDTHSGVVQRLVAIKHLHIDDSSTTQEQDLALHHALSAFQRASKLPVTGIADEATKRALVAAYGV